MPTDKSRAALPGPVGCGEGMVFDDRRPGLALRVEAAGGRRMSGMRLAGVLPAVLAVLASAPAGAACVPENDATCDPEATPRCDPNYDATCNAYAPWWEGRDGDRTRSGNDDPPKQR